MSFNAEPIVRLDSVSKSFGDHHVLEAISFTLQKGEFVYLVGRTGVGKSTILKLLYGDVKAQFGSIEVGEFQLKDIGRDQVPMLRRRLGIVFQDYQLLPDRNVYDNILFALKATGWKKSSSIKQRISEVLMKVGMSGKSETMPHQLSGGEQQRVSIARALINEPVLLIADEPTGNLDPEASAYIMEILRRINLSGTAIMMATHEYSLIKEYPARVLELDQRKVKDYESGPQFLSAYGSRLH
ncbi:ATP-binding cassette domain-containing protein [Pontibacter sp. G13]|uniref:cell division ATP-binding protein FtsE n=1 Tax=Pontibacter sp. G13 TaxID=3074898 RepID=UPI0028898D98|nr:ATP-binding cassette domain-containing protein [Pontibacter sp. G13]WNJ18086.1 ATP-binding cassette domain-containing protein [Pontibacter sp. G13]